MKLSVSSVMAASIIALACDQPPPGSRQDQEAAIVELALRQRLKWLRMAYGANGIVYCVDYPLDLAPLQAEGFAVRDFMKCASPDLPPHVRGPLPPPPDHGVVAPLFVKRVSWPEPRRGVVELLDGGVPKEKGISARVASRFEFVWKAPAWTLAVATAEETEPEPRR